MVIAGKQCPKQASREEVAEETVKILKRCVPPAVPGIAFLSGGQSDEDATAHLHLHERHGPAALEAVVLLRPRAAGGAAEGLERQVRERGRRAARLRAPRQDERARGGRQMEAGSRKGGLRRRRLTIAHEDSGGHGSSVPTFLPDSHPIAISPARSS